MLFHVLCPRCLFPASAQQTHIHPSRPSSADTSSRMPGQLPSEINGPVLWSLTLHILQGPHKPHHGPGSRDHSSLVSGSPDQPEPDPVNNGGKKKSVLTWGWPCGFISTPRVISRLTFLFGTWLLSRGPVLAQRLVNNSCSV